MADDKTPPWQSRDSFVSPSRQSERDRLDKISQVILDSSIEIHRKMGPGLLESVYQQALAIELRERGLFVEWETKVEATWRGQSLGTAFRAELIVERCVLIELKAVADVTTLNRAQVRTYLKLLDFRLGLLINFNALRLIDGYERIYNRY